MYLYQAGALPYAISVQAFKHQPLSFYRCVEKRNAFAPYADDEFFFCGQRKKGKTSPSSICRSSRQIAVLSVNHHVEELREDFHPLLSKERTAETILRKRATDLLICGRH